MAPRWGHVVMRPAVPGKRFVKPICWAAHMTSIFMLLQGLLLPACLASSCTRQSAVRFGTCLWTFENVDACLRDGHALPDTGKDVQHGRRLAPNGPRPQAAKEARTEAAPGKPADGRGGKLDARGTVFGTPAGEPLTEVAPEREVPIRQPLVPLVAPGHRQDQVRGGRERGHVVLVQPRQPLCGERGRPLLVLGGVGEGAQESADEGAQVPLEGSSRLAVACGPRLQGEVVGPELVVDAFVVVAEVGAANDQAQETRLIVPAVKLEQLELGVHGALFKPRPHARICGAVEKGGQHNRVRVAHRKARVLRVVVVVVADEHPAGTHGCRRAEDHALDEVVLDAIRREEGSLQKGLVPVEVLVAHLRGEQAPHRVLRAGSIAVPGQAIEEEGPAAVQAEACGHDALVQ